MTKNEQLSAIKKTLEPLEPTLLEIVDESDRHEGHGGWRAGMVTHVHIRIASPRFEGLNRVARHRLVLDALTPLMTNSLHAVRISIK